jgi:4'-phosphopantetheinyl transferase EntD
VTFRGAVDPRLERDIATLAPRGLLIAHRLISSGDEDALSEEEAASLPPSVVAVRRASGSARIAARELLAQLGHAGVSVPKAPSGAPIWPAEIVGSIAHDERVAIVAVGLQREFGTVGIDIEAAVPLPDDMLDLIANAGELRKAGEDPLGGKLLFAVKEAVYKAAYPLDRVFLEFRDIEVDLAAGRAVTRTGRVLALRTCVSSHIIALALPASAQE